MPPKKSLISGLLLEIVWYYDRMALKVSDWETQTNFLFPYLAEKLIIYGSIQQSFFWMVLIKTLKMKAVCSDCISIWHLKLLLCVNSAQTKTYSFYTYTDVYLWCSADVANIYMVYAKHQWSFLQSAMLIVLELWMFSSNLWCALNATLISRRSLLSCHHITWPTWCQVVVLWH